MPEDNLNQDKKSYLQVGEIGSSGLERTGGRVYEEFLPQLSGDKALDIFKEMSSNDPVIGSILYAIEMLVRQVEWRVEPASREQKDLQAAEFLESVIADMDHSWQELISEIMSMLTYGWSFHEIVYKRRKGPPESRFDDGFIGWKKLPIRSQDTRESWNFSENGAILGMNQMAPPYYKIVTIPMSKALLFRTSSRKNNPEGKSILRNAYRPWYFKKNIEEIEGIGIERDLAGLPTAWVPPEILDPGASAEDKRVLQEVKNIIKNIRRDEQEGVVFPQAFDESGNKIYDLELLSSGGRRQFDTNEIIDRYDQRIAMSVMADFILLGSKQVGSFALASSKTKLFAIAVGAWLDEIAEVFNRSGISKLFRINGFEIEEIPKLVHGDIEEVSLEDLAKFIRELSGAGAMLFPDEELESYLKRRANLPTSQNE